MPHLTGQRKRKAPARRPRGGRIRPSEVLGGISAAAAGAAALGITAPLALPLAGITGLTSGILRLFGQGGVTQAQMRALRRAERQGLVITQRTARRKAPKARRGRARRV